MGTYSFEQRAQAKIKYGVRSLYLVSSLQLYLLAEASQLSPSPAFGLTYEGAIGQPR